MRYYRAKCDEAQETYLYRDYVTESLRLAVQGKFLTASWHEIVSKDPVDTRTGDEVALEVISRLGLKTKGGEEELGECV